MSDQWFFGPSATGVVHDGVFIVRVAGAIGVELSVGNKLRRGAALVRGCNDVRSRSLPFLYPRSLPSRRSGSVAQRSWKARKEVLTVEDNVVITIKAMMLVNKAEGMLSS